MSPDQLRVIMPAADVNRIELCRPHIMTAMAQFAIETRADQAAFIATVGHETGQLRTFEENLNYSAEALLRQWPRYFTPLDATAYARQPERIANRAYANRGGNGDEASGDGWRHRGAGGIQLTFKNNQVACAAWFNRDPETIGEWLRTPEGAMRSAGHFWMTHDLSKQPDFDAVCDYVNLGHRTSIIGDSIGWIDRQAMYSRALAVL